MQGKYVTCQRENFVFGTIFLSSNTELLPKENNTLYKLISYFLLSIRFLNAAHFHYYRRIEIILIRIQA